MSVATRRHDPVPSKLALRRLVAADAFAYRALMLEAYERHPDAFTSSVDERAAVPLSFWESRLVEEAQPMELVVGAFQGGELAGVAGLSFESRAKSRHKAKLFGMYVLPRFRQGGVGFELVVAALATARARAGVKLVQLTVTDGNDAAQVLYGRCGFVPFGIEPFAVAVGDTYVSKIHMWCDLGVSGDRE